MPVAVGRGRAQDLERLGNGKVSSGHVYVDGLSVGDIGGVVLRTRRMLSRDGIVVVIIAAVTFKRRLD